MDNDLEQRNIELQEKNKELGLIIENMKNNQRELMKRIGDMSVDKAEIEQLKVQIELLMKQVDDNFNLKLGKKHMITHHKFN